MSDRIIVVGGGVIGTMHAYAARTRGLEVVHLEREPGPRGASVRNFGLVWVSGRAAGAELELALRARELWEQVARDAPGVGFRPDGSLTLLRDEAEVAVCERMLRRADANQRGLEMLDAAEIRKVNPAVKGTGIIGALRCDRDGVVEPGKVLRAIRQYLSQDPEYRWLPGRQAVRLADDRPSVRDHTGEWHHGDRVVLAVGATFTGIGGEHLHQAPLRRCRLQMMQTAAFPEKLTTAIADADTFRYYPAYRDADISALRPQPDVAAKHAMQLLMVQRADGGLTIGDTHAYNEPFDFAVEEAPYEHLHETAEALLGTKLPPIVRRWAGVYSETTDEALYHRADIADGVTVVTAPGGRGMTCSPAIAEETFASEERAAA